MMGRVVLLAVLTGVFRAARGQSSSSLCGRSIDIANASGTFLYTPDFEDLPQAGWATTVYNANGSTESSLWFSTGGGDYTNDLAIRTDACAQIVTNLPTDTIELAQDDPGDCSKTLSDGCRQALISQVSQAAYENTRYAGPSPYSNLTAGVMSYLCGYIFDLDQDTGYAPKECDQEFGQTKANSLGNANFNPIPLTGNNSTGLATASNCTLGDDLQTYHLIQSSSSSGDGSYNVDSRSLVIAITTYFTVANIDRDSCCMEPTVQLSCIRPRQFSEGSRVAPALASGTPYVYPHLIHGLTVAQLVGAIVGPVLFSILVTGLAFTLWQFWRRGKLHRRRNRVGGKRIDVGAKEVDSDNAVHELNPRYRDAEADGAPVAEMGQGYWKWVELEPNEPPAQELEGDLANGYGLGREKPDEPGDLPHRNEKSPEPPDRSRSIDIDSLDDDDRWFDAESLDPQTQTLDPQWINDHQRAGDDV